MFCVWNHPNLFYNVLIILPVVNDLTISTLHSAALSSAMTKYPLELKPTLSCLALIMLALQYSAAALSQHSQTLWNMTERLSPPMYLVYMLGFWLLNLFRARYLVIKYPPIYKSLYKLTRLALLLDELLHIAFKNFRTLDTSYLVAFPVLKGKVKRKILKAEVQISDLNSEIH